MEIMRDVDLHPIQSLSMATNASIIVGANNRGKVYVMAPDTDTKVRLLLLITESPLDSRSSTRAICVVWLVSDPTQVGVVCARLVALRFEHLSGG